MNVSVSLTTPPGLDGFGEGLRALRERYIRTPWRPATIGRFDLFLEQRGLFREVRRAITDTVPFRQSADDFVRSYHGRASNFLQVTPILLIE